MERKNAWLSYNEDDMHSLQALAEDYKAFLNNGKTERECVAQIISHAYLGSFCLPCTSSHFK